MPGTYAYLKRCPTIPDDADLFFKSLRRFRLIDDLDPPAEMRKRIEQSLELATEYCRQNRPFTGH